MDLFPFETDAGEERNMRKWARSFLLARRSAVTTHTTRSTDIESVYMYIAIDTRYLMSVRFQPPTLDLSAGFVISISSSLCRLSTLRNVSYMFYIYIYIVRADKCDFVRSRVVLRVTRLLSFMAWHLPNTHAKLARLAINRHTPHTNNAMRRLMLSGSCVPIWRSVQRTFVRRHHIAQCAQWWICFRMCVLCVRVRFFVVRTPLMCVVIVLRSYNSISKRDVSRQVLRASHGTYIDGYLKTLAVCRRP